MITEDETLKCDFCGQSNTGEYYPVTGNHVLCQDYEQKLSALRAQLAEAVEALKPFAHPDLSEILAGNTVGEESIVYVRNNATLTVKDFRRAAEIINRIIQSND